MTNIPSSCYNTTYKSAATKRQHVDSLVTSAFEKINENIIQATRFMEKEVMSSDSSVDQITELNPDTIFRSLILVELNNLDAKTAKSKRRKLLALAIEFDSDSE